MMLWTTVSRHGRYRPSRRGQGGAHSATDNSSKWVCNTVKEGRKKSKEEGQEKGKGEWKMVGRNRGW